MLKTLTFVFGLSIGCLATPGTAGAAPQAPTGHRQPSAADSPSDDAARGADAAVGRSATKTSRKRSQARRGRRETDNMMKTPNICSNCDR
jgi:hypothetical protein